MMGKKRSLFGVFKDVVEEDCEPKLMKKENEEVKKKKKKFFSAFEEDDLQEKKKDEKVFKFKKDPKESIKNHFAVTDKEKKPSPVKKGKKDVYADLCRFYADFDSSSEDEKEEPVKKFSFSKEQDRPKKISKDFTFDSPRKTMTKNRRSIVKMVKLSKSYGAVEEVRRSPRKSSQSQSSGENSKSQSKSTKEDSQSKKKPSKKKKKDQGLAKIDSVFKPISVDDLLKLPETVGETGLTMDEILDQVDVEIREQKAKDAANMKILDQTIEKQREKIRALKQRMAENAELRDKLTAGLTQQAVKDLFEKNLPYLEGIREGTIESARHDDFHKSSGSRQALLYKMITHPFTEDQVDWTFEEFRSRWMPTTKEFHQLNDYIWKVLLPECFIKFYMDFFQLTKVEAETKIKETPMIDEDEDEDD